MATRRTFEGSDLEALLREVRRELGDEARIISAEKTRSGGIGGFFVKEEYVVVAENPAPSSRRVLTPVAPARPVAIPASAPAPVRGTMDRLLAMADAVSDHERITRPVPVISPSGPALAAATARAVRAAEAARRSSFDLLTSSRPATPAVPAPAVSGAPRAVAPLESVFARAERMGPVIDLTEIGGPGADQLRRPARRGGSGLPMLDGDEVVVAHTSSGRRLGRVRPAFTDVPRLRRRDLDASRHEADAELDPPAWVTAPARAADRTGGALATRDALLGLGVPATMIESTDVTSAELADLLDALPVAARPEAAAGDVIVYIGDLDGARQLAARAGGEVVVAAPAAPEGVSGWLVLRDPAAARSRRAKWAGRDHPTVVAIAGDPFGDDPEWVMTMLDAVGPDELHLVVDASWAVADLADWVAGVCAVVDDGAVVIDLVGVATASAPAAAMSFGLPIETVDGTPANGGRWAEMLLETLLSGPVLDDNAAMEPWRVAAPIR